MKKEYIIAGLAIAIAVVALLRTTSPLLRGGSIEMNRFTRVASSSAVTLSTSSSRLTATSTARCYVEISNISATAVFLSYNSDAPAVVNKGITLFASSTITLADENLYTGAIQAIATAGTPTVTFTESTCN